MIFNKNDIAYFEKTEQSNDGDLLIKYRLSKDTGVYFSCVTRQKTDEFMYFSVGTITSNAETQQTKSFTGDSERDFFSAVDYFEELISKRQPKKEKNPPSVGYFVYSKTAPCFVKGITQEPIFIDKEDVYKVFTPPKNKPFGRLNMLDITGNATYDPIAGKFALKYDEDESEIYNKDGEEFFAYKMTPYQSSENSDDEDEQNPDDVNDEDLSKDDIEGEDDEGMKGENKDENGNEDENSDDTGDESESGDSEDGDSDSDENGDDGDTSGDEDGDDGEKTDGDEDGDESGNENGDADGDGDENGQSDSDESNEDGSSDEQGGEDSENGDSDNENGEPGDEGDKERSSDEQTERDGGDEINTDTPGQEGEGEKDSDDNTQQAQSSLGKQSQNEEGEPEKISINASIENVVDELNDKFNVDDLVRRFRTSDRMINVMDSTWTDKEVKETFYDVMKVDKNISVPQFKKDLREYTKPYFGEK